MHPARAPQVNPGATEPLDVLRGNAARIPYLEGIGPRRRFQVGGSGPSVRGIQPHAPRPAPGLAARVLRGAAGRDEFARMRWTDRLGLEALPLPGAVLPATTSLKEFLVKKFVAAAVAAGVLSVGFAGTVQAAPKPDGWGGSARVKASKSVAPVDVSGLRRTPRM